MPNLRNNPKSGGQVKRNGQHNRADMHRVETEEFARDNLKGAYAGKENTQNDNSVKTKSTNVKGRQNAAGSGKTPKL